MNKVKGMVFLLAVIWVFPAGLSLGQEEEDGLKKVNQVQENLRAVESEVQQLNKDLAKPSADESVSPPPQVKSAESAHPDRPEGKTRVPDRSELLEMVSSGDPDSDLVDAALLGDTPRVSLLLRRGAHVNARGSMGMTALMHAAQNGQTGVINELLLAGADVNAQSASGYTALACAAMAGQAGVLHTLVLWGADVHARGFAGMTALLLAAQNGHTEAVRVLASWGADVNQGNDFNMTPLMFAARKGQAETVKLLLELRANVNAREKIADQTALVLAETRGHTEVVKILYEAGGTS